MTEKEQTPLGKASGKYQAKLNVIKVKFPNEETCGIDYAALIRTRAKELGFTVDKGTNKGEGSANAYILHLIEQDLGIDMNKSVRDPKVAQE